MKLWLYVATFLLLFNSGLISASNANPSMNMASAEISLFSLSGSYNRFLSGNYFYGFGGGVGPHLMLTNLRQALELYHLECYFMLRKKVFDIKAGLRFSAFGRSTKLGNLLSYGDGVLFGGLFIDLTFGRKVRFGPLLMIGINQEKVQTGTLEKVISSTTTTSQPIYTNYYNFTIALALLRVRFDWEW